MTMSNSESRKRDEEARAAHNAVSGQTTARIEAVRAWFHEELGEYGICQHPTGSPWACQAWADALVASGLLAATLASTLDEEGGEGLPCAACEPGVGGIHTSEGACRYAPRPTPPLDADLAGKVRELADDVLVERAAEHAYLTLMQETRDHWPLWKFVPPEVKAGYVTAARSALLAGEADG